MKTKIKLSEKQKEVIKLMRNEDCEIYTSYDETNHSRWYQVADCKEINKYIHHSTFFGLKMKGIIGDKPFHLTELGKTIQL